MVTATPEKSHAACPTHSEVITSMEARPLAACVTIVHDMLPAGHIRLATVQVLATSTLTKVESILPEETMAICDRIRSVASATGSDNNPSVSSVGPVIPEEHPSMTTTLEELQSHKTPPTTNILSGHSTTPAVQAVVVDCISIVDPQLASIIGYELEVVTPTFEDSQAACPTCSEVISASITRPSATSVAIVHIMLPTGHVRLAIVQVLASATLAKVIDILPKEPMTISGFSGNVAPATSTHNSPAVPCVCAMVPKQHPGVTTTFEHLKSHKMPATTHMLSDLAIAPPM
jgi:hypothetical protein